MKMDLRAITVSELKAKICVEKGLNPDDFVLNLSWEGV